MPDYHKKSFFGQKTALVISSSSSKDPFTYFNCFGKRKGVWERPSKGDGRRIKCGLGELVMISEVLEGKRSTWSTVHQFNGLKTRIVFKMQGENLLVNIDRYNKRLGYPQVMILKLLVRHILQEKIEFSTSSSKYKEGKQEDTSFIDKNELEVSEECQIRAKILRKTDKALYIELVEGNQLWVPKSSIKEQFDLNSEQFQRFMVDGWVLRSNLK